MTEHRTDLDGPQDLDDTEGHRAAILDADEDDTEGHRAAILDADEDDTEGHRAAVLDADEDDTEGHLYTGALGGGPESGPAAPGLVR